MYCVYISMDTYMDTRVYLYMQSLKALRMLTPGYFTRYRPKCVKVYEYTYIHIDIYIYIYMYMYIYTCIYIQMYIWMNILICMYIHTCSLSKYAYRYICVSIHSVCKSIQQVDTGGFFPVYQGI